MATRRQRLIGAVTGEKEKLKKTDGDKNSTDWGIDYTTSSQLQTKKMWSVLHRRQFAIIAGFMQLIFIGLYARYVKYIDPLDDSRRVYSGTDYPCGFS